jgi:AraC-like DNA-binding protein/ligand-binding sensor protein
MQTTFVRRDAAQRVEPGEFGADAGEGRNPPRASDFKKEATLRARSPYAAPGGNGNGNGNGNRALVEALVGSRIYQEYERAFSDTTGLPVALRPVESWQLPLHGKRNESPFCQIMAQKSRACGACLQVLEGLSQRASQEPQTVVCPIGMCDTAVPVRLGDRLIGFLQTGQVFRKRPTPAQFERAVRLVGEWGVELDRETLKQAYFATTVVAPKQHEAVVKLLTIFAQHLSMLSNQVVVQHDNAEPPVITRAKEYIHEHQTEELSLGQVAKAVNTSTFYFCKMFKKVTGINFTDYLSRVRIEKSKNLLLNPNLRVSEIAFEVGFQSLTHFNRVFKKILGQSPTEYRAQLLGS